MLSVCVQGGLNISQYICHSKHMYVSYLDMQNTVSDCEGVTVSAFLAQDSDITERIKGQ